MADKSEVSPQQRLAVSRKAIVKYMTRDAGQSAWPGRHAHKGNDQDEQFTETASGRWPTIKRAVSVWWQHHPAQLALDLAKPVLGRLADRKPLQLLGVAAATGAAVVLIRPWRLVSMTGLLLATLKSSEVSALLLSLLSRNTGSTTNPRNTQ